MTCKEVQNRLSFYVDQELSQEESRQVRAHLFDCAECSCELKALEMMKSALCSMPVPAPSEDLEDKLLARIACEAGTSAKTKSWRPLTLAVATFSVFFVGWLTVESVKRQNTSTAEGTTVEKHQPLPFSDPLSPVPNASYISYEPR